MRETFVAKLVLVSILLIPLAYAQTAQSPDNGIPKFTSRSELVMAPTVLTDNSQSHQGIDGLSVPPWGRLQPAKPPALMSEAPIRATT